MSLVYPQNLSLSTPAEVLKRFLSGRADKEIKFTLDTRPFGVKIRVDNETLYFNLPPMHSIKPTLFIGSSREGLPVAELVKKHLSDFADCKIWNEPDVFVFGNSYFETLNQLLSLFEYGVLIGTADDRVTSRKKQEQAARDNVLFEFGLFMGRLGREKVFFIKEKDAKTPSDLAGVKLPEFSSLSAPDLEAQIAENCRSIVAQIESRSGIFDGGIYPSVPLAYGYFHNSLLPAARQLTSARTVRIEGEERSIGSFQFSVLIPDDLRSDMKEKVEASMGRHQWVRLDVPMPGGRSYGFYTPKSGADKDHLVIYDIPTTLNSLHQTIQEFVGSGKVGVSIKEQLVERREIRHFQKVVEYLVAGSSFTNKGAVVTEIIDI
jgi:predicted nucleotide-binding protein